MMIVKILLGVLCLSGWLILSRCRQYHFVNESLTWYEAQTYCRKNYRGLACIGNSEEMNQFINTVSSAGYKSEVWIGVYVHLQRQSASQNDGDYQNWENQTGNEPFLVSYFCQSVSVSGRWYSSCSVERPFICYNGTSQSPEYVFVNKSMDWLRALRYCRENVTDIASYSLSDSQLKILVPNGDQAWIGAISQPEIRQRDCGNSSFRYWDDVRNSPSMFRSLFGVADLQRSGKWRLIEYVTKIPFVCFDNLPAPGKENVEKKVIKMSLKLEDSSVDLNDRAVKANLRKKLQDKLKEKGVNGVTLKWRKLRDGDVFHKEETNTKKEEKKKTEL